MKILVNYDTNSELIHHAINIEYKKQKPASTFNYINNILKSGFRTASNSNFYNLNQ
ncbi:hypothetical protein A1E_03520 [Rickettsia canadensis str. McKiel]|uniref:Uncharacterized protein n=1 Tax=Rickettsia canadensis (strain McKiel) TaxID=293613 RepID=A8EZ56_RICCK|nr:hypothetical protein A1E_03520 [Rickettsia canadensis str. McKiel]